jgi:hypothetical protein
MAGRVAIVSDHDSASGSDAMSRDGNKICSFSFKSWSKSKQFYNESALYGQR